MILYEISAFTRDGKGGNKAGVILNQALTTKQKQEISKEANYSECVFATKKDKDTYQVEYFTPTEEIDFCGHASLALAYLLKQQNKTLAHLFLKTKHEIIEILYQDKHVYLKMPQAILGNQLDSKTIAPSLNIATKHIIKQPQIIQVGIPDIMILIDSKDTLFKIKPNLDEITKLSKQHEVTGYHMAAIDKDIIYTRNFAPLYGIDEESATGSASGSMFYYLLEQHLIENDETITFYQGDVLNEPSKIIAFKKKNELYVGGACHINRELELKNERD